MKWLTATLCVILMAAMPAEARSKRHTENPASAAGEFDYYVLSLSWSPVFCETHPSDREQCGTKRYGFVLHGLWPQYENGGYPATCATGIVLDEEARKLGRQIFPSESLIAHEWDKHGTCSGMKPRQYFQTADDARNSVKVPAKLQPGTRVINLKVQEISSLLKDANPALTNRSLAVVCARKELSEVRVCLSKDLKPRACGRDVRDSCPNTDIRIPGVQ